MATRTRINPSVIDVGGKVTFRLGALEPLGDRDLADLAALHHFLANRLGLGPAGDGRDHAHAAVRLVAVPLVTLSTVPRSMVSATPRAVG